MPKHSTQDLGMDKFFQPDTIYQNTELKAVECAPLKNYKTWYDQLENSLSRFSIQSMALM